MRSLTRTIVLCAAALMGCGGTVTTHSDGQHLGGIDGGDPATGGESAGGRSGSASGGSGGNLPSSTSSGDSGTACPLRVPGTDLTEADCYACIGPDTPCVYRGSPPGLSNPPPGPERCVSIVSPHSTLWCAWYPDGAQVDRISHIISCETSPGFIACGGGI